MKMTLLITLRVILNWLGRFPPFVFVARTTHANEKRPPKSEREFYRQLDVARDADAGQPTVIAVSEESRVVQIGIHVFDECARR